MVRISDGQGWRMTRSRPCWSDRVPLCPPHGLDSRKGPAGLPGFSGDGQGGRIRIERSPSATGIDDGQMPFARILAIQIQARD